jgi:hypothetical protein
MAEVVGHEITEVPPRDRRLPDTAKEGRRAEGGSDGRDEDEALTVEE